MLLAGTISHTRKWYMDFVKISMFYSIHLKFILLVLIGVELRLCLAVALS